MTDLAYRFGKFTPLVLALVFFATFLWAGTEDNYATDIDLELSMLNETWAITKDSIPVEISTDELSTYKFADPKINNTDTKSILNVGKKANISKTLPSFEVSLLNKGKYSTVALENKFNQLIAKKSKLKILALKQTKKATKKKSKSKNKKAANAKLAKKIKNKKFKDESKKYKVFVANSKWQPKKRSLSKTFKKALNSGRLSKKALVKAFKYYEKHKSHRGLSDKYLVVADYTKSSRSRRMHLINLKSGAVSSYQVAHGRRSGPVGGRVHSTSNLRNSNMTSKGFFKVGYKEGRTLKKGYKYLSITGLEKGNRKVGLPSRQGGRDVVIHTASYVNGGGRSNGCFAIRPQDRKRVFNKIKGALLYSYAG